MYWLHLIPSPPLARSSYSPSKTNFSSLIPFRTLSSHLKAMAFFSENITNLVVLHAQSSLGLPVKLSTQWWKTYHCTWQVLHVKNHTNTKFYQHLISYVEHMLELVLVTLTNGDQNIPWSEVVHRQQPGSRLQILRAHSHCPGLPRCALDSLAKRVFKCSEILLTSKHF